MTELATLAGGYLNQDWSFDYRLPDDAIAAFVREGGDRHELISELRSAISSLTEPELADLWSRESAGGYYPLPEYTSYACWLGHVIDVLEQM